MISVEKAEIDRAPGPSAAAARQCHPTPQMLGQPSRKGHLMATLKRLFGVRA